MSTRLSTRLMLILCVCARLRVYMCVHVCACVRDPFLSLATDSSARERTCQMTTTCHGRARTPAQVRPLKQPGKLSGSLKRLKKNAFIKQKNPLVTQNPRRIQRKARADRRKDGQNETRAKKERQKREDNVRVEANERHKVLAEHTCFWAAESCRYACGAARRLR